MVQVLIKMTFANQIQKWMNCQRWWWFIDSSKVPRVSLARGTLYVHCTHMDVGRLGCSYILHCRLLACLPGCVAATAGTAVEHGHRLSAAAVVDGYGEIGHISSVCKLLSWVELACLLNKHFYHHSTAAQPRLCSAKLSSASLAVQRCDLHAANRVQTSLNSDQAKAIDIKYMEVAYEISSE